MSDIFCDSGYVLWGMVEETDDFEPWSYSNNKEALDKPFFSTKFFLAYLNLNHVFSRISG